MRWKFSQRRQQLSRILLHRRDPVEVDTVSRMVHELQRRVTNSELPARHLPKPSDVNTSAGMTSSPNEERLRSQRIEIEPPDEPKPSQCLPTNDAIGTHFRDGRRRIDYVLVEEILVGSSTAASRSNSSTQVNRVGDSNQPGMNSLPSSAGSKLSRKADIRQTYLENLKAEGLELEEEWAEGKRANVRFIKLHAPWPVLCRLAEDLGFRARLTCQPKTMKDNWSAQLFQSLKFPNPFAEEIPGDKPKLCYTYPFRQAKVERLVPEEERETYFTTTERSRIVNEILAKTSYGDRRKGEVGIDRLLEEGLFKAAYPLHEGSYEPDEGNPQKWNSRQVLYAYWARWSKWSKYQPLDSVREYFGEKIALYFAWLGFYTAWLIPPSIVGILIFFYGLVTMNVDPVSTQVCQSKGNYTMCPLCDEKVGCHRWDLSDVCAYSRLSYLFDHPGTVFFAVFVSFWAVTFLEYWKRHSMQLAHRWDLSDVEREEIRPRPEFALKAPSIATNPVTGIPEPAFPGSIRRKRIMAGICFVVLMVCMVIIFIVAIIVYRIVVSIPLFKIETFKSQAQVIANLSGAIVNLGLIMLLGRLYEKGAHKLTTWEMHRTQIEFEDSLTFKVFAFQFVNLYASIFYIAFFKGRFVGYPGQYLHIFGLRNEECTAGGCLVELSLQLVIIMIGKQFINNVQEIVWPKVEAWWQNRKVELSHPTSKDDAKQWEDDYQLVENAGLFQEYLEMVMQFGFITIFVAAFPLAPLFALLNNVVEIRLDAQKFVCSTRRTVGHQAKNIGIWLKILEFLAHLAVISNAFLIAFTSEFLPKILYQYEHSWSMEGYVNSTLSTYVSPTTNEKCLYRSYRDEEGNLLPFYWKLLVVRLAFVVVFEHFVFGVCRLIDVLVPDVPKELATKMKRDRYLAKQILQDPDHHIRINGYPS